MSEIKILHKIQDLRDAISLYRKAGKTIGLVPTMGNLHAGHISLTKSIREHADIVCATLFVNPKQFGKGEDFGSYPRTLEHDAKMLQDAGVELLFAPNVDEMYPSGFSTTVSVKGISNGLCGVDRPVHFDGVCTVVTKLLLQAMPDVAIFGEKDYQQLMVIKRFVRDLDIPVEIIGGAILREEDGLAMSSRNNYLSLEERAVAPMLQRTLQQIVVQLRSGQDYQKVIKNGKDALLEAGFDQIDYLEICDEADLSYIYAPIEGPQRVFVAAHLGKARLIDNIAV